MCVCVEPVPFDTRGNSTASQLCKCLDSLRQGHTPHTPPTHMSSSRWEAEEHKMHTHGDTHMQVHTLPHGKITQANTATTFICMMTNTLASKVEFSHTIPHKHTHISWKWIMSPYPRISLRHNSLCPSAHPPSPWLHDSGNFSPVFCHFLLTPPLSLLWFHFTITPPCLPPPSSTFHVCLS